jgi:selenocysteine-specific elongation factor
VLVCLEVAMNYSIVGTAGHVDHGKTELVKALTGVNTDRLKEEQQRGISIELGFAPLTLGNGQKVGLVDVPGHEKFIKQMLAGVGGMDLVMLIIAADEGIMPQTQEHLDIINLLQVKKGLIVITKKDLVDEDWLALVTEEVKEAVVDTVLQDAPILACSSITKEGISELKKLLENLCQDAPSKAMSSKVRLPIDRIFSITGFGTVVTGTLWSGKIVLGDTLEVLPEGLTTRIRSLQVHGKKVEEAVAGQRTAANLANIEVSDISRGSVLVTPNTFVPSRYIDVEFHLLKHAEEINNRTRVRVHSGTSEVLGRLVLLDREKILPGQEAFCQLQLEEVLVTAKNDRFVIRSYSPAHTIGGGVVLEPKALRHKRFHEKTLLELETKKSGAPDELLMNVILGHKEWLVKRDELIKAANLDIATGEAVIEDLKEQGEIILIKEDGVTWVMAEENYERLKDGIEKELKIYHAQYPLRPGSPKEEIRSRLFPAIQVRLFSSLLNRLAEVGQIKLEKEWIALNTFNAKPNEQTQKILKDINHELSAIPFQPLGLKDIGLRLKLTEQALNEYIRYLVWQEQVVKISEDIYFIKEDIALVKVKLKELGANKKAFQLAEVRDLLNTSRKYVLPLLEYFDQIKFTKRIEDKRIIL